MANFLRRLVEPLGLLGLLTGLYFGLIYDRPTSLTYEILSNSKVVAVDDTTGNLEVVYAGQQISKEDLSLSVIVMRVANTGQTNIRPTDFNERDEPGFEILNGRLADRPELVSVSNEHLRNASPVPLMHWLKNKERFTNQYCFVPVLLDKGDHFTVKIMVIHKKDESPVVKPIGQISGGPILVIQHDAESAPQSLGFWQKVFFGNSWINLVRFAVYIVFIIFVGVTIGYIKDRIAAFRCSRRRNAFERFKSKVGLESDRAVALVETAYVHGGSPRVADLKSALEWAENPPSDLDKPLQVQIAKNQLTGFIFTWGDANTTTKRKAILEVIGKLLDYLAKQGK